MASASLADRLRAAALDLEQHGTGLSEYRYTEIITAVREAAETLGQPKCSEHPDGDWDYVCIPCTEQSDAAETLDARSDVPSHTLENIAMFARRGLSFGNQATPQTPEHVAGQRAVMLRAILRKCEEAGVTSSPLRESPSPLTEAKS